MSTCATVFHYTWMAPRRNSLRTRYYKVYAAIDSNVSSFEDQCDRPALKPDENLAPRRWCVAAHVGPEGALYHDVNRLAGGPGCTVPISPPPRRGYSRI